MANNGLPDFQFATPVTSYQQGMQMGNALQGQQIQNQNALQNQQDQNALRANAADALYGTGDTQTNALKTIAGADPSAAIRIGDANAAGVQAQLAAAQAKAQSVTKDLVALTAIPAGPAREQAYQATLDREQAAGQDVSAMRNLPADQGIKLAYMKAASINDAFKSSGLGPAEGTVVAPGGVLADKNTGKVLFNNPAQGDFQGSIPLGNGTTGAGLVNRNTGQFTPLTMAGGSGQPATASSPATPPPSFATAMNQMIAGGATPDQAMQQLERQYPTSQISVESDPATGQFKDATPSPGQTPGVGGGSVSGGGAGGGTDGLGFGIAPAKPASGTPSGYRYKSDGSGSLEPIPGGPADASGQLAATGMSPDAITDAAWDKILNGKDIQGMGKDAVQQRAAIRNQVATIASQAGVSPQDLVTTSGRNKALQASLTNLQKQGDVMAKNEETFNNNAQVMLNLSDQVGRSGIPAFNNLILNAKNNIQGDPTTASFLASRNLVAQEYAKIASGATGAAGSTEGAQEHALSLINTAQTPDQLRSVIGTLGKDIQGQKQATADQLNIVRSHMSEFGAHQSSPSAQPPDAAVARLKANPGEASQFDQIFGQGASAKVLGNGG